MRDITYNHYDSDQIYISKRVYDIKVHDKEDKVLYNITKEKGTCTKKKKAMYNNFA